MYTAIGTQQALRTFTELHDRLGMSPGYAGLYTRAQLSSLLGRESLLHALNDCFAFVLVLFVCLR
jgi:hypothetical protein